MRFAVILALGVGALCFHSGNSSPVKRDVSNSELSTIEEELTKLQEVLLDLEASLKDNKVEVVPQQDDQEEEEAPQDEVNQEEQKVDEETPSKEGGKENSLDARQMDEPVDGAGVEGHDDQAEVVDPELAAFLSQLPAEDQQLVRSMPDRARLLTAALHSRGKNTKRNDEPSEDLAREEEQAKEPAQEDEQAEEPTQEDEQAEEPTQENNEESLNVAHILEELSTRDHQRLLARVESKLRYLERELEEEASADRDDSDGGMKMAFDVDDDDAVDDDAAAVVVPDDHEAAPPAAAVVVGDDGDDLDEAEVQGHIEDMEEDVSEAVDGVSQEDMTPQELSMLQQIKEKLKTLKAAMKDEEDSNKIQIEEPVEEEEEPEGPSEEDVSEEETPKPGHELLDALKNKLSSDGPASEARGNYDEVIADERWADHPIATRLLGRISVLDEVEEKFVRDLSFAREHGITLNEILRDLHEKEGVAGGLEDNEETKDEYERDLETLNNYDNAIVFSF